MDIKPPSTNYSSSIDIRHYLESGDFNLKHKFVELYQAANVMLADLFIDPGSQINISRSKEILSLKVNFIDNHPESFPIFLSVRKPDYITTIHSVNVCIFLIFFAKKIGIKNNNTLMDIAEGALLHDLGKIRIPSEIINKKGKLTTSEWDLVIKHPDDGAEIARETRQINELAILIIQQHHEKIHGKGYPRGLPGCELNKFAKMVTIVDVFDAVTTNRPYSFARNIDEAIGFLLSIKEEFDENLLLEFINLIQINGEL